MIKLEPVTKDTFQAIMEMKLPPEQSCFVAPNVASLALAWLYPVEAHPYAICNDHDVVGFMMLDWDEEERSVGIWRFMIAAEYQHKGYGRKAMIAAIEIVRSTGKFDLMHLNCVPGNQAAYQLYLSLGFRENGEVEEGELVMTMEL